MRRTLITFAVALTVVVAFVAEADFWDDHSFVGHDSHHSTTLLTSLRIAHSGEIALDETQTRIVSMSPDASLEIGERRFLTRRWLEVRPDASGKPQYELKVGSRPRSEEDAQEFLALMMEDVVRSTTIGAQARARRILASGDIDGVLDEVARLDSNSARRIYIEIAASSESLTEEGAARIAHTAGYEINSSSRLRSTLVFLAEEFPSDWAVTGSLIEAAENIGSSSDKGRTLVELARIRGLNADEAVAMSDAVATISSGGEIVRTVQEVVRLEPTPEIIEQMLEPVSMLSSSHDRRRALDELISYPDLTESTYQRALELSRDIASSGERASFMSGLAGRMPDTERLQRRYIEIAGEIASSGDQSRTLTALLRSFVLSEELCRLWIETAGRVSSSGTAAGLLAEASRECPDNDATWQVYLAAVRDIPSSGDQRRALMALLERDGLGMQVIRDVALVAEDSIASTGESRQVKERAHALLVEEREPVEAAPSEPTPSEAETVEPESGDSVSGE
jgi:hypothetical protein